MSIIGLQQQLRLRRLPGSIEGCVRVLKEIPNPHSEGCIHSIMIAGCYSRSLELYLEEKGVKFDLNLLSQSQRQPLTFTIVPLRSRPVCPTHRTG
jgi:hypothetical protein